MPGFRGVDAEETDRLLLPVEAHPDRVPVHHLHNDGRLRRGGRAGGKEGRTGREQETPGRDPAEDPAGESAHRRFR
ncbi:MAG: hypothetical protein Kow00128_14270 [Deltaproteobacteria bacterium]